MLGHTLDTQTSFLINFTLHHSCLDVSHCLTRAAWAVAVALGFSAWLGFQLLLRRRLGKMSIPRFNFTRLLIDLAMAHNTPQPIFIPANHPLPGHHAFVCQYCGVDAIGGGATEAEARNAAARQVWIEMGHLISIDPR